ncbi:MAG: CapA family protein [Methyloceanibacter sp.]|uniref:CapA family protein n=1 Tax=Methyloceanibacter sp. TaxID=1965321 RepID=UPI003D6D817F
MPSRLLQPLGAAAAIVALVAGASALKGAARLQPCASTEVTASIGAAAADQPGPDRLTIVLAGDAGFNPKGEAVAPEGFRDKDKKLMSFPETLSGIAKDVDGDLAFVNLETVVTDRNDLVPDSKGQTSPYNFKSHPLALKALIDAGFNLFSLANNHSMDYGANGAEETLYHMAVAAAERAIAYAGIGTNFEEATRPGCLELGDVTFGFGATGIVTGQRDEHRAGENKPGQAEYRHRPDFELIVNRLAGLPVDYRILSIHYGLEGRVVPDKRQLDEWRGYAARDRGIDLIVGHHPHVAQGVELAGGSLIFYGLGNFIHPGTTEMTRFGVCRDYGLMAKVHLARIDGDWRIAAIEAIPLTKTHMRPERFSPQEGVRRIYALNHLGAQLSDGATAEGVRFTPRADGTGLYCTPDAAALGGKQGALCASWRPAPAIPKKLGRQLAAACADKPFYGAGDKQRAPSPFGGIRR